MRIRKIKGVEFFLRFDVLVEHTAVPAEKGGDPEPTIDRVTWEKIKAGEPVEVHNIVALYLIQNKYCEQVAETIKGKTR